MCTYDYFSVITAISYSYRIHILRVGTILGSVYVVALPDRFGLDFRVYLVMPTDGDSWCSGTMGICQVSFNLLFISQSYMCFYGFVCFIWRLTFVSNFGVSFIYLYIFLCVFQPEEGKWFSDIINGQAGMLSFGFCG